MLEPDLIEHMKASLTGIAGGVHLGNVPQDCDAPAISVTRISGTSPRTLGGRKLFSRADVQIVVVGDDRYAPVMAAANQVRELLEGFRGPMRMTLIESCLCEGDPADNSVVDGNKVIRALSLDFKFTYRDL